MTVIIKPFGKEKARLMANTGLTQYTIDGHIENGVFTLPMGDLHVWKFRWADIREQVVRDHMLKETIGKRGLNKAEAMEYLNRVLSAVPQDEVEIEVRE